MSLKQKIEAELEAKYCRAEALLNHAITAYGIGLTEFQRRMLVMTIVEYSEREELIAACEKRISISA